MKRSSPPADVAGVGLPQSQPGYRRERDQHYRRNQERPPHHPRSSPGAQNALAPPFASSPRARLV
jgi:hypothetical protein